jgi:hypothetical protein
MEDHHEWYIGMDLEVPVAYFEVLPWNHLEENEGNYRNISQVSQLSSQKKTWDLQN